jgi:hypothetical protein
MMKSITRSLLLALAIVGFTACGDDDDTVNSNADAPVDDDAASMCIEGSTDCDDTPTATDGGDPDAIDEGAIIEEANRLIGLAEDELDDSVRIGRRGDEYMILTEDYQIGRMTAELDPDDLGVMRVTSVIIELTDGPVTVPE